MLSKPLATTLPCVVLAGGRASEEMRTATGHSVLPLVPIAGRPMLAYVLDALSGSQCLKGVWVVGPAELQPIVGDAVLVPEAGSMLENIQAGMSACEADGFVLLCTADVPFLTPTAVDNFVRDGVATGADMCYPIVAKEVVQARYPTMRRTFVRTRDGVFTGGNMVLVRESFFPSLASAVERLRAARKSPLRLAAFLGPIVILRLLTGTVSISGVEARAAKLFGGAFRAIISQHPEVAADVDKPEDLAAAEALLSAGAHDTSADEF